MHFLAAFPLLALLAGSGSAQVTATSATNTTMASMTSTMTSMSAEQSCVAACAGKPDTEIVGCQAACVNVPYPNRGDVESTNKCAAACPQGNGTKADADAYSSCLNGCISSYYMPQSTGSSGSSGSSGSAGGASNTASASRSASATGARASASGESAADRTKMFVSATGLLGLFAAFLAL